MDEDQTAVRYLMITLFALPSFALLYLGSTKLIRLYRAFGEDSADPEAIALKQLFKDARGPAAKPATEADPRAYLALQKINELKRGLAYLFAGASLLVGTIIFAFFM